MRIGVLLCDKVSADLEDQHGTYLRMFSSLLPDLTLHPYNVFNGDFPPNIEFCQGYLMSGSRYSVYDDLDWILELKHLVKNLENKGIPFMGVCFGHQILAEALGGKVEKAESGWCVAAHECRMEVREVWMRPSHNKLNLLMMCQDQVIRLPHNATVLASSPDCPVAMFRVRHHMVGVQAHPEFPSAYVRALIEKRRDRIGEQKSILSLKTLREKTDSKVIGSWITNFFRHHLQDLLEG